MSTKNVQEVNQEPKTEAKATPEIPAKPKVPTNASILFEIFKRGVKNKDEAKKLLIKAQLKAQKKELLSECVNSKKQVITEEHLTQQVTGFLRNLKAKDVEGRQPFYKTGYEKDTWFVIEDEVGIRLEKRECMDA